VKGILADINIQGHVELLQQVWESDAWRELWTALALPVYTFPDVGLHRKATDEVVWQLCQHRELVLVTANRNDAAPDSLESTIRRYNTPTCLPVFTLADVDHLRLNKVYAGRVAVRLLEFFFDIEQYRGTGRMYVP
jgi:hypothetical protein